MPCKVNSPSITTQAENQIPQLGDINLIERREMGEKTNKA